MSESKPISWSELRARVEEIRETGGRDWNEKLTALLRDIDAAAPAMERLVAIRDAAVALARANAEFDNVMYWALRDRLMELARQEAEKNERPRKSPETCAD